jgi:SAM-dependent methyltransferase
MEDGDVAILGVQLEPVGAVLSCCLGESMSTETESQEKRYRLRFTGSCSREEFQQRCAEHKFWYHSYYFDNGFEQPGDYDIGHDIESYGFPEDMNGMQVLDVGTGSGWFATFFEQRGAEVTTVDVRGYCDFDVFGRHSYPEVSEEKQAPDLVLPDGRVIYYSPVSKGFWIMKDILSLEAKYVNARVYDLCPKLFGGREFDLVFMGSLLMHLRDPFGALMAARSVCRDRLIANSMKASSELGEDEPRMELITYHQDKITWWRPNRKCLLAMSEASGFSRASVDRTVNLTTDKVYTDESGRSTGLAQTLMVLDARI